MTTRREFLVACSAAAAGLAVAPEAALATPATPACSFEQLGLGHFAARVRTSFRVNPPSAAPVSLKLIQAEAHRAPSGGAREADAANERFSLLFRGPANRPLEQNTYDFSHREMGQFSMFIVPVGAAHNGQGRMYEAVFNRPASGSTRPA